MINKDHNVSTSEIVKFLSDSNHFPEYSNNVELKETHMSYVFITDNFVYKMKKPVLYPFLNLSTLDRRKHNCQKEIASNKTLAPDVYIGTVPLSLTDVGMKLEGQGTVIEWFVKMIRLPEQEMLDYKIREGEISIQEIISLGRKLSVFYKQARKKEMHEQEYLRRLRTFLSDNLESLRHPAFEITNEILDNIKTLQLNFIARNEQHLSSRSARIIEAHGDLRPEHICFLNEPVIIDALEFNPDFRIQDPVEELSYFSLECEILGNEWIGKKLLEVYESESNDHYYKGIESFYKSIRATLRALSSFRHLLDDHRNDPLKWKLKGLNYLMMAQMYISG
ncbi:hypothetical protein MYP_3379 [Sporocytophaga myxococcoides]|uniref:Aminoglycoside phosphotransferase domain-containing protein n=1 Tax=Sporocytophaga myxococcoides TaxID=153721 RepID=A0A098LGQ0_9BACT|nr:hypothetical protein [Sporocytophaga myxococcoides]GAL86150.1 hypothetical protein MYP_3379 [Sporocytophaga myxococcoides]